MIESPDDRRRAVIELLALAMLMAVGYLCTRTLRFTNDWLNLVFQCVFFLMPFLTIQPVRQLRRRPRVAVWIILAPLLALSLAGLLVSVSDISVAVERRELSRKLSSVSQGSYSVHLLWVETSGGALGPHGLSLEQRMVIIPGLYMVKYLDYFEGAHEGSLSAAGTDKVRLHIPNSGSHPEVDQVYPLKHRVYFD